ncbi:MAG: hypothetical protein HYS81_02690 [Candidatus Aenigmatarchaeota archaeon]|nr:MAG: hypothetical protein HYS81_02690 [Candidatus Aenigmarchaeota archaeon]
MYGKGLTYTLEAVIALSLVAVSMIAVFNGLTVPQGAQLRFGEENAFSCLKSLDSDGKLRADAVARNAGAISNNLIGCIRGSFNHTVQVCQGTCTSVTLDRDEDVASVEYYIAGHNTTNPTLVVVYAWSSLT